jgi:hypothetical protein
MNSKSSSSSTSCSPSAISGDGSDILDSSNFHSETGEGSKSSLGSGSWGFGFHSPSGSEFNMETVDFQFLATGHDVMGGQHGYLLIISLEELPA